MVRWHTARKRNFKFPIAKSNFEIQASYEIKIYLKKNHSSTYLCESDGWSGVEIKTPQEDDH